MIILGTSNIADLQLDTRIPQATRDQLALTRIAYVCTGPEQTTLRVTPDTMVFQKLANPSADPMVQAFYSSGSNWLPVPAGIADNTFKESYLATTPLPHSNIVDGGFAIQRGSYRNIDRATQYGGALFLDIYTGKLYGFSEVSGSSGAWLLLSGGGGSDLIIGTMVNWLGYASLPPGAWIPCNGQKLLRATYAELYEVVGAHFNHPEDDPLIEFRLPVLTNTIIKAL